MNEKNSSFYLRNLIYIFLEVLPQNEVCKQEIFRKTRNFSMLFHIIDTEKFNYITPKMLKQFYEKMGRKKNIKYFEIIIKWHCSDYLMDISTFIKMMTPCNQKIIAENKICMLDELNYLLLNFLDSEIKIHKLCLKNIKLCQSKFPNFHIEWIKLITLNHSNNFNKIQLKKYLKTNFNIDNAFSDLIFYRLSKTENNFNLNLNPSEKIHSLEFKRKINLYLEKLTHKKINKPRLILSKNSLILMHSKLKENLNNDLKNKENCTIDERNSLKSGFCGNNSCLSSRRKFNYNNNNNNTGNIFPNKFDLTNNLSEKFSISKAEGSNLKDTKRKLKNKLEKAKILLNKCEDFNLFKVFSFFDKTKSGLITKDSFFQDLIRLGINCNVIQIDDIFEYFNLNFNLKIEGMKFSDFCELFTPSGINFRKRMFLYSQRKPNTKFYFNLNSKRMIEESRNLIQPFSDHTKQLFIDVIQWLFKLYSLQT